MSSESKIYSKLHGRNLSNVFHSPCHKWILPHTVDSWNPSPLDTSFLFSPFQKEPSWDAGFRPSTRCWVSPSNFADLPQLTTQQQQWQDPSRRRPSKARLEPSPYKAKSESAHGNMEKEPRKGDLRPDLVGLSWLVYVSWFCFQVSSLATSQVISSIEATL